MPLIPSPHDDKIDALNRRMKRQKGPNKMLAGRLDKIKGRQDLYQERNRPASPMPYSGEYDTTVGRLNRDRDFANSDSAGRELATEQQYGFGADQSNPFSIARTLERNAAQQQNRSTNSFAAQGQLYSGALSRARTADRFSGDQALDSSLRSYQGELGDIATKRLGANREYDEGVLAAEAQRLQSALEQPVDPAEAPPRSKNARNLLKDMGKKASKLDKRGNDSRAKALRKRIAQLKGPSL